MDQIQSAESLDGCAFLENIPFDIVWHFEPKGLTISAIKHEETNSEQPETCRLLALNKTHHYLVLNMWYTVLLVCLHHGYIQRTVWGKLFVELLMTSRLFKCLFREVNLKQNAFTDLLSQCTSMGNGILWPMASRDRPRSVIPPFGHHEISFETQCFY